MNTKPVAVQTMESLLARTVEEGECLIWRGYVANKTPQVAHNGKMVTVRRLMLQLQGKDPKDYCASSCGDPLCVAPHHIVSRSKSLHLKRMTKMSATDGA